MKFEIIVHDKLDAIAISERPRPEAYLIHKDEVSVIKKLQLLGLNLDSVLTENEIVVEQYIIEEYAIDAMKYEGVFMQKVKAKTNSVVLKINSEWLVLKMNQRKSNLAIEVLEPEAPNSFVSYSVIPTEKGATLPIYRVNKKL